MYECVFVCVCVFVSIVMSGQRSCSFDTVTGRERSFGTATGRDRLFGTATGRERSSGTATGRG